MLLRTSQVSMTWMALLLILTASLLLKNGTTAADPLMPVAMFPPEKAALPGLHALAAICLCAGRGTSVLNGQSELSFYSQRDISSAVGSLQPDETLQLEMKEVHLNSTLFVTASDIVIRGAHGMTTVRCPEEGGAFLIT